MFFLNNFVHIIASSVPLSQIISPQIMQIQIYDTSPEVHAKFVESQRNGALQRHLLVPFPVAVQSEFGKSMQLVDELQTGSGGGFHWILSSCKLVF